MGRSRLELHEILKTFVDDPEAVYFQPTTNVQMKYPAIVYTRDFAETLFADNDTYRHTKRYMVKVIDRNPDSPIPDKVAGLPMCTYNRFYTANNLNHDVFTLFF